MALNGKYISFQSIVERVYRKAGYQTVDWAEAIEIIGDTIKVIGSLPAYKNVTTNGTDANPVEVADYRAALPSDLMVLEAVRKVNLLEDADGNLSISSFSPMYENTDLYYKSPRDIWTDSVNAGTYDYTEFKQVNHVTLTGTSGTATIGGPLTKTVTFATSLSQTAANFVAANAAAYLAEGITLTADDEVLEFKATVCGFEFDTVTIANASGDLSGTVTTADSSPVQVYNIEYTYSDEYSYQFKIDNDYIITNFEEGYLELSYKAFVTDDHGFPKIPDDQRFINAITWSIIEQLDYKKWRVGEIADKVYAKSEREKLWYIGSARSKADIPSPQKMESLKNMFLRTITKTNEYTNYFKYSNIPELRYNWNKRI